MSFRSVPFSRIVIVLVVALIGIQVVPVERSNPPSKWDVTAPDSVRRILRRACYDCHSNETEWPWYSRVAPFSWIVTSHVREARGDLNFSEWPRFDAELERMELREIAEEVSEGEMPLWSYTMIHRDARLHDREREIIVRWASANVD